MPKTGKRQGHVFYSNFNDRVTKKGNKRVEDITVVVLPDLNACRMIVMNVLLHAAFFRVILQHYLNYCICARRKIQKKY